VEELELVEDAWQCSSSSALQSATQHDVADDVEVVVPDDVDDEEDVGEEDAVETLEELEVAVLVLVPVRYWQKEAGLPQTAKDSTVWARLLNTPEAVLVRMMTCECYSTSQSSWRVLSRYGWTWMSAVCDADAVAVAAETSSEFYQHATH